MIAPYSIVYSCIFIRFTSVHLWLFCANSTFHFDTDGTNDTHDTQIQMSELVIKFLGYFFEYGALSPPLASPRSGRGAARHSPQPTPPRVEVRAQPTVLSPPRPLTLANAPGRRVLAPQAMWPRFLCGEHDGEGWEATVEKVRSGQGGRAEALVAFVARRKCGAGWKPMWLQLSSLRPLR